MRALATFLSVTVLVGIGAAGYVLVDGAQANPPTTYWCMRALDRADNLDQLTRDLDDVRFSAAKAHRRGQAAKYRKRLTRVHILEARSAHERDDYRSAAARCRDAR